MKLVIEFEFPDIKDSNDTEADKILEKIGNIDFEDEKTNNFYWKVVGSSN